VAATGGREALLRIALAGTEAVVAVVVAVMAYLSLQLAQEVARELGNILVEWQGENC